MAGAGFGFTYVPPLVQYVIDEHGWRPAYWVLAAITIVIAAPVVGVVFRDTPAEKGLRADGEYTADGEEAAPAAIGLTVKQSLRRREFWLLWVMFCALSFSLYGLLPHFVPMLTDRGMQPADAAWAASSIGVTIIIARVVIGYLIDRFFAPRVALVFFLLSAGGIGLLAASDAPVAAFVAAILVGLSIGAEIDLLAYLSGRYFGLRHFGAVYGLMFAALLVGTSAGPVSFGAVYELQGSYLSILVFCALLNVAASFVMALMPRYPEFRVDDA
jgi:predicted MFS family arabinose efflux permease